jgi:hypothetical protein
MEYFFGKDDESCVRQVGQMWRGQCVFVDMISDHDIVDDSKLCERRRDFERRLSASFPKDTRYRGVIVRFNDQDRAAVPVRYFVLLSLRGELTEDEVVDLGPFEDGRAWCQLPSSGYNREEAVDILDEYCRSICRHLDSLGEVGGVRFDGCVDGTDDADDELVVNTTQEKFDCE